MSDSAHPPEPEPEPPAATVHTVVQATGLDHIVLRVADAEASMNWYVQKLGLVPERLEQWRAGQVPFPSVRINAETVIDLLEAESAGDNLDHFAVLITDADLDALAESGEFNVVRSPRTLWGAQGAGLGMYVADPDGNVVELRTYPSAAE